MNDEVALITSSGDQSIKLEPKSFQREMEEVDEVMAKVRLTGDPRIALHHVRRKEMNVRAEGLGVARVLYETYVEWEKFTAVEDEWENVAQAETGLAVTTCRKYRDLWANVFANKKLPEWIRPILPDKPIRALLLIGPAARDGDLDEADWSEIANSQTDRDVREVIHRARGLHTSANAGLSLTEDRNHVIKGKIGSGGWVPVAHLMAAKTDLVGDGYEFDVRRAAIARLRGVGVQQQ